MTKKNLVMDENTAKELYKSATPQWRKALEDTWGADFFLEDIRDRVSDFKSILKLISKTYEEVVPWSNPKTAMQKRANCFCMQDAIAEAYNGGKKPDFDDSTTQKHFIWLQRKAHGGWVLDCFSYDCVCACPGVVYFNRRVDVEDAWKKFPEVFIGACPE